MRVWCCPYFFREIEAVVAGSMELSELQVETHAFSCQQNFQEGQGTPASLFSGQPEGFDAIIGGACLGNQNSGDENLAHVIVPETRLCFHLVAPAALVDSLIFKLYKEEKKRKT